jgi:hypothetical protein
MTTSDRAPESDPPPPTLDLNQEVKRLSSLIGQSPDPTTGRKGSGLLGVVATIHTDVQEIKETFGTMAAAQGGRKSFAVKLALSALIPVFAAVVAAVTHYLGGFHR